MNSKTALILILGLLVMLSVGCKRSENRTASKPAVDTAEHTEHDGHSHDNGDDHHAGGADHGHDEVSLGMAMVGDLNVEFAQGHGAVEAGKEGHLVVKLPYNDKGQTIVRTWIGTENRLTSVVGKSAYAPSHDDYDVHTVAPDPLPDGVRWWVEIEKPDGTKLVGSIDPLLK